MNPKLFVGNLSWETTDDSLAAFFSQVGTVVSAKVITDRDSGRSKGFGFVEMSSVEEAERARNELNDKELDGRTIKVSEARPQENRPGGGGGRNFNQSFRQGGRDNRRGDFQKRNRY